MSLPAEVISGAFAETTVVSLGPLDLWTFSENLCSRLQRVTYLHRKLSKLQGSSSFPYSNTNLSRHPVLETQQLPVDSSNYFPPLDGRPKVCELMLPLLWIWFGSKLPLLPKVSQEVVLCNMSVTNSP